VGGAPVTVKVGTDSLFWAAVSLVVSLGLLYQVTTEQTRRVVAAAVTAATARQDSVWSAGYAVLLARVDSTQCVGWVRQHERARWMREQNLTQETAQ